jgi:hypothetical protein
VTEANADDGAIHRFWAFIIRRRARGQRFDLDDLDELRAAIDAFEHEEGA